MASKSNEVVQDGAEGLDVIEIEFPPTKIESDGWWTAHSSLPTWPYEPFPSDLSDSSGDSDTVRIVQDSRTEKEEGDDTT